MSQVDKDLVAKARAEASTARQRWKDAKDPRSKGEGEKPLMEDIYIYIKGPSGYFTWPWTMANLQMIYDDLPIGNGDFP